MDLSGIKKTQKGNSRNKSQKPKNKSYNKQKLWEQKPNYGFQQKKTFEQTPQQQQQFKKGACINCRKQNYYIRDCRQGKSTKAIKVITNLRPSNPRQFKWLKGTRGYIVKHFAFCYNNRFMKKPSTVQAISHKN